jgi:hypothetical protein
VFPRETTILCLSHTSLVAQATWPIPTQRYCLPDDRRPTTTYDLPCRPSIEPDHPRTQNPPPNPTPTAPTHHLQPKHGLLQPRANTHHQPPRSSLLIPSPSHHCASSQSAHPDRRAQTPACPCTHKTWHRGTRDHAATQHAHSNREHGPQTEEQYATAKAEPRDPTRVAIPPGSPTGTESAKPAAQTHTAIRLRPSNACWTR